MSYGVLEKNTKSILEIICMYSKTQRRSSKFLCQVGGQNMYPI